MYTAKTVTKKMLAVRGDGRRAVVMQKRQLRSSAHRGARAYLEILVDWRR